MVPPKETASTPTSVVSSREAGAERGGGVGEAGAVDVEEHPARVGGLGERRDLGERVDGAELGRLGQIETSARLDVVLVAAPRVPAAEVGRVELAVLGLDREQLDAGDSLGRAALVDVQVGGRRRR